MNDLTTKPTSNSDLSQAINDNTGSKLGKERMNELSTIPSNTTVAVGRRKKLVGRIAAIIGVALITGITASVVIVVQRKSENITEGTVTTTTITTVTKTTKTTRTTTTYSLAKHMNLVINGGAETGPCATTDKATVPPTEWNYNGSVTQLFYTEPGTGLEYTLTVEPKDRGRCFFFGQQSSSTSMWQRIDFSNSDDFFITNQALQFNLSAWIGGWREQEDHASVSLTFLNKGMNKLGNSTTIGPVSATDRENRTKLLFKSATGFIPNDTYFLEICVEFIGITNLNDGCVDNIALILY